jgi:hypothetical protein
MTHPEPAESCQVSLLVPHPRRTAVLVAAETSPFESSTPPQVRLPTLRLPSREPHLPEILASVDVVDTDTTAVLRTVMTSAGAAEDSDPGERGEVTLMVEFEAVAADAPSGWVWQDLDADVIARLEPEASRAAVASWARERVEGWSPLRPAWSRPGWFARASTWMVEQMAEHGHPAVGTPRQHQLWNVSIVLRAPSEHGEAFFKCSAEIFRHEAATTQALAERMPTLVPEVIAVDRAEGWMLMGALGAVELGDQGEALWPEGLVAVAGIQRLWLGRTDELIGLGLPVRSLTDLATQVEEMGDDPPLLERMSADVRARWLATTPSLAESCRRLDELGPGPTLVHGDFHPWNVVLGADGARVFDWTDAAVTHPFVDLVTYVFRSRDVSVRRRLVDAYLAAWSTEMSEASLHEAAALALVVGTVYQVQTYRALLPTLPGDGADDGMAEADLGWVNRTLARQQLGLESPI